MWYQPAKSMDPDLRTALALIDLDEENADQKSPYMRKPGYAASHPYVQHLQDEPETKNYGRRNRHDANKEKQKEQGQDIGSGVKDEIGSQHTCNGAAGSYHRDL